MGDRPYTQHLHPCSIGCNLRMDSRTHKLRRMIGRENMRSTTSEYATRAALPRLGQRRAAADHAAGAQERQIGSPNVERSTGGGRKAEGNQEQMAPSIGAIGSAKLGNESNYLLQRFFRQLIGTNNIDHRDGGDVAAMPTGLPALADVMKPQYGPDPKAMSSCCWASIRAKSCRYWICT